MTGIGGKEEFWALKNINFSVEKAKLLASSAQRRRQIHALKNTFTNHVADRRRNNFERQRRLALGSRHRLSSRIDRRENVFLNGAILGMSQKEIASKFDRIVEFSGVEKFLDTPVKYYSSGMYVRLAFAVAAHMEPDILIVDEVLAVGDSEFQKKCLGKMDDITSKEGRTVLFVSHNMTAIKQLCKRCILLEKGQVIVDGPTDEVVGKYEKKYLIFPIRPRPSKSRYEKR